MKDLLRRIKMIIKKIIWLFSDTDEKRNQLEVFLPLCKSKEKIAFEVPEGYVLRCYRPSDAINYTDLMQQAGFTEWSQSMTEGALKYCVPHGFFVVEHLATGKLVATFMARHITDSFHPYGGRLDWLAVDPQHRGNKLGFVVVAAAANRLIEMGYQNIYITTDDHRLAAISNFLKGGFIPSIYCGEMLKRWESVCARLRYAYEPTKWDALRTEIMISLEDK